MNRNAATGLLWLLLPLAAVRAEEAPPQGDQAIRCANLIYAGTETSRCFSDQFLSSMQQLTAIPTERRFKSVKLASAELFGFPFVVMTGEASFTLTAPERENLKKSLASGGFLLASAGCSRGEKVSSSSCRLDVRLSLNRRKSFLARQYPCQYHWLFLSTN